MSIASRMQGKTPEQEAKRLLELNSNNKKLAKEYVYNSFESVRKQQEQKWLERVLTAIDKL